MTVRLLSSATASGGGAIRTLSSEQQPTAMQTPSTTISRSNKGPEFVAVVLASSTGTRLFPLTALSTSTYSSTTATTPTLSSSSSEQDHPKHLLPVAGIPMLHRLLHALETSLQFTACVVAIARHDQVTLPSLQQLYNPADVDQQPQQQRQQQPDLNLGVPTSSSTLHRSVTVIPTSASKKKTWKLTVVRLPENCLGSGQALRALEQATYDENHDNTSNSNGPSSNRCLPVDSHLVVLPGDLIVLDPEPLRAVLQAHRHEQQVFATTTTFPAALSTSCTVLLTNVAEVDEHGVPLKESAKHKKGGLAREEEEIEYVALSTSSSICASGSTVPPPRLIWKQAKLDAEEDEHHSGATPKLALPKPRLQSGQVVKVRTDWNDVYVYVLAPWLRTLIQVRDSIVSLREDLLPLIIARQFKGVVATFGSSSKGTSALLVNHQPKGISAASAVVDGNGESARDDHDESSTAFSSSFPLLEEVTRSFAAMDLRQGSESRMTTVTSMMDETMSASEKHAIAAAAASLPSEYAVRATVQQPTVFRSHTVPAYLYANREMARKAMEHQEKDASSRPALPPNSTAKAKFQSVLMPGTTLGDKVTFKATVVGKDCKIGGKCRLNNVVLLDHVHVADNTILQNTVVAQGAKIGENCSLNDCQVGPDRIVPAGTKGKGETFLLDDLL